MDLDPQPFDAADYLADPESVRAFLEDAMESGDARVIAGALGVVARAKGMSEIAEKAGLSRESLYRALSSDGNPRLDTLMRVLDALGIRLHASSVDAAE
jgi:probable addiction module antidote protein